MQLLLDLNFLLLKLTGQLELPLALYLLFLLALDGRFVPLDLLLHLADVGLNEGGVDDDLGSLWRLLARLLLDLGLAGAPPRLLPSGDGIALAFLLDLRLPGLVFFSLFALLFNGGVAFLLRPKWVRFLDLVAAHFAVKKKFALFFGFLHVLCYESLVALIFVQQGKRKHCLICVALYIFIKD